MIGKKQKLVLVFEENRDERMIDSKVVRLYMNRVIIGEDNQNDIIGVREMLDFPNGRWSADGGGRLANDLEYKCRSIHQEIIEDEEYWNPLNDQQSAFHFIVGSHLGVSWGWPAWLENAFERIGTILTQIVRSIEPRSCMAFTLLGGEYIGIRSKDFVRVSYKKSNTSSAGLSENTGQSKTFRGSIGDDLEKLHDDLMSSSYAIKEHPAHVQKCFLFHPLTKSNIRHIGSFVRPRRVFHAGRKARRFVQRKVKSQNEPEDRFIEFQCSRMTFFVQNSDSSE